MTDRTKRKGIHPVEDFLTKIETGTTNQKQRLTFRKDQAKKAS